MSEEGKSYMVVYGDFHEDGFHKIDKSFRTVEKARELFDRLDPQSRYEGFSDDQIEAVRSCIVELHAVTDDGLHETLDAKRWTRDDHQRITAPERNALPEGWVWSDLAARRNAGSDIAYGLAERMVGNPDAKIDDLIQEQAAPAMDRSELFEWVMADAANLAAVEDVFDKKGI